MLKSPNCAHKWVIKPKAYKHQALNEALNTENTINYDESPETGQIQAKGPSGEGRRPQWRRIKPPSGEG